MADDHSLPDEKAVEEGESKIGFLTQAQKQVLRGEFEGSENARSTHRSRIRTRARFAIAELAWILRTDEFDNADILEPEDIKTIVKRAIGEPKEITPFWEAFSDKETREEYTEKYQYERSIANILHLLDSQYHPRLFQVQEPNTDPELIE